MMFKKKVYVKINVPILLILLSFLITTAYYIISRRCQSYEINDDGDSKPKYRLLIVIVSAPQNADRRDAIRRTWLSKRHNEVKHFFALGTLDTKPERRDSLQFEKEKYDDLLLLPNLQDTYGTLTKKVLQSYRRIYQSYYFDFALKCDDDSLVLVDQVLKELDRWERRGTRRELYWGFFNGRAQVKRSGPWKESDWILCDYYLPYALGGGYVLSYNLVKFIADNWDILKLHTSEDVSVGLWLASLSNIERMHDVRFDTEYRSRGCSNEYIITHKQSIQDMTNTYQLRESTGALCFKEIRNRMSYKYNWTVPPSQCCNRQAGIP